MSITMRRLEPLREARNTSTRVSLGSAPLNFDHTRSTKKRKQAAALAAVGGQLPAAQMCPGHWSPHTPTGWWQRSVRQLEQPNEEHGLADKAAHDSILCQGG